MKVNMTVVGSIAYDTLETPKGKREKALGGSAIYFSTVASFFTRVGLVGIAGKDFEKTDVDFLKSRNVDLSGFEFNDSGDTFNWVGSYAEDFGDATTHSTSLNVFEDFNPVLPREYADTEFLFLANIHPALQLQVLEKTKKPRIVALDTMNLWIDTTYDLLCEVIKKIDILFINQQEALMLARESKFANAVDKLLEFGPRRIVIKLGELGAMTATKESRFFVPPYPCPEITDPTGAGDSFAGGFMGSLARNGDFSERGFRDSMLYGSAMGSITVENFSLDSYKTLTKKKIEERYKALKDMVTL